MRNDSFLCRALYYFFAVPFRALRGLCLCKRLFPDSRILYVVPYQGIGDIMATLGSLREYVKKNGFQSAKVFYTKAYSELCSFYDFDFAEKDEISVRDYRMLARFFCTWFGLSSLKKKRNVLFTDTWAYLSWNWEMAFSMRNFGVFRFIREGIMGLGECGEIERPCIPEILKEELPIPCDGRRIAVLNPHSKTILISDSKAFYQKLAKRLAGMGYFVLSDCGRDGLDDAVEGTTGFRGNLAESFNLCRHADLVIGTRSGWLDLMALSGAKVVAVYGDDVHSGVFMNAFDIGESGRMCGMDADKFFQVKAGEFFRSSMLWYL